MGGKHDMWSNETLNEIFGQAGFFPITMSKGSFPAIGIVIDWEPDGTTNAVIEFPMTVSCPN
jgi:hypothetical protein